MPSFRRYFLAFYFAPRLLLRYLAENINGYIEGTFNEKERAFELSTFDNFPFPDN